MALNLADGQLGSSSAALLSAGTEERVVAVTLFNTVTSEQTIVLTNTRSGSSARTFVRAKLKQYQSLYVRGIALDPSDSLAGYSSSAEAVDYLVCKSNTEPFSVSIRDADGTPKASTDVTLSTTEKATPTVGEVIIAGWLEECRDLLLKIASG